MGWKSRSVRARLELFIRQHKAAPPITRVRKVRGVVSTSHGSRGEELTFSCACWERAGVDEKVLSVVEQTHPCMVTARLGGHSLSRSDRV